MNHFNDADKNAALLFLFRKMVDNLPRPPLVVLSPYKILQKSEEIITSKMAVIINTDNKIKYLANTYGTEHINELAIMAILAANKYFAIFIWIQFLLQIIFAIILCVFFISI